MPVHPGELAFYTRNSNRPIESILSSFYNLGVYASKSVVSMRRLTKRVIDGGENYDTAAFASSLKEDVAGRSAKRNEKNGDNINRVAIKTK